MLDPDTIRERFSQHGIRCTKQREDIYAVLHTSCEHPTAEELYRDVRIHQPGLSLATVYNTLEIFTKRGLCRRLGNAAPGAGAGSACRYDANLHEHTHLLTTDGQVRDVPEHLTRLVLDHIPLDVVRQIEQEMGVVVERLSVDFIAKEGNRE
ncbi:MAG: transcriptional repressor [Pyrinomonadaceae bacterium]|nr:transcriptional repressor [Phycisphaerales bacterium]